MNGHCKMRIRLEMVVRELNGIGGVGGRILDWRDGRASWRQIVKNKSRAFAELQSGGKVL